MLNYSKKKNTLLKQTISQHEQRLLVKSAAWTCHTPVYIPFEDNLNFLCCSQANYNSLFSNMQKIQHFPVLQIQNVLQFFILCTYFNS